MRIQGVFLTAVDPEHVLGARVQLLIGLPVYEARPEGRPGRHEVLLLARAYTKEGWGLRGGCGGRTR